MKKGLNCLLLIFASIFLINFISAEIEDTLHLNIQVTDANGNRIANTEFNFVFNITTDSNCENVVYSNSTSLTTDNRGLISYYLENVNLNYTDQYYLCYYRNTELKSNSRLARVPYAFNSKYLGGYTENFFAPLNTSLNGNFTISGSLFINGIDALNGSSEDSLPLNTIIFYNGTSCPQGFSELTAARGRYIVGLPSGGTLNATVGTALSDSENRAVGEHNHDITDPGHFHAQNGLTMLKTGSSDVNVGGTTTRSLGGNTASKVTGITINNNGSVAGTNAPYIQYLTCIKTATVDLTQGWNQDATSIWTADSTLKVGIGTSSPQIKLNVVGDINATGVYYGNGSQLTGINKRIIISGYSGALITTDGFFHPSGGALIASDTDESQLMRIPYAGTLHNLTLIMSENQASSDVCALIVRYTPTFATSTSNTALVANMSGGSSEQIIKNLTENINVAQDSYIKMFFDEEADTCNGIISWSFVYEPT